MTPTRVMLMATTPQQMNGYSAIGYEFAMQLSKKKDIQLTYWGFQNFYNNTSHNEGRKLPDHVQIYDAFANEKNKSMGFGFEEVTEFVIMNKPDVIIIYNDMVVVSNIIEQLKKIKDKKFKIMVYIDQVYLCQRKEAVKLLNENADFVIAFTPYWEQCIKGQGLVKPTDFLYHGFNPDIYYPCPKNLARMHFGLKNEEFIILNLNRNQPRKRWDITLMAFAEVVSKHIKDPIKLLIGTAVQGAWNLLDVYERELSKHGLTLEEGMKHIILIDNPQQLSDEEINILYNASDIGINTCDGEGAGLNQLQHGAIGRAQIVPSIGGLKDFLDKESAIMIEPKLNIYIDNSRDGVGGESQVCHHQDFADAIEYYYTNPEIAERHGKKSRENILKKYQWDSIGDKLYNIIQKVAKKPSVGNNKIPLQDILEDSDENEDINKTIDSITDESNQSKKPSTTETVSDTLKNEKIHSSNLVSNNDNAVDESQKKESDNEKQKTKRSTRDKKRKKEKKKVEKNDKNELIALKAQIEKLLSK